MTEPPHPPSTPDEPWASGEANYPPPQGGGPRPGPGPDPQQGFPGSPSQQQPYPQPYPQPGYGQPGGYPQPGYGQPGGVWPGGYSQGNYPPAQQPPGSSRSGGLRVAARLGPRLARRPEPRFGISLAAAGAVLAVVGVLVWSIGYFAAGLNIDFNANSGRPSTHGEGRRFLGAGLSLLLVAAGYALVLVRRRGPLATAGVVASAIGIPLVMGFLTLDVGGAFSGQFPINIDAIYIVSVLAWLISYFAIPGAQGRAFYLGLAALNFATYVGYKAAGNSAIQSAASSVSGNGLTSGGSSTDSLGAVGLVFGLSYYAIAAFLDKRGRSGPAVALAVAGFFVTVTGVVALARSFGLAGTGALLIALGAGLAWYGGHFGRRFTTWVWGGAFGLGVILIVAKISPNNYTAAGITLIVVGAIVAIGAHVASRATREQPDIDEAQALVMTP